METRHIKQALETRFCLPDIPVTEIYRPVSSSAQLGFHGYQTGENRTRARGGNWLRGNLPLPLSVTPTRTPPPPLACNRGLIRLRGTVSDRLPRYSLLTTVAVTPRRGYGIFGDVETHSSLHMAYKRKCPCDRTQDRNHGNTGDKYVAVLILASSKITPICRGKLILLKSLGIRLVVDSIFFERVRR